MEAEFADGGRLDLLLDTVLARLGSWTGTGINTILGAFRALCGKKAALTPTDLTADSVTFDNTTDSMEAIRDTDPLGTAMRGTDGAYTGTPPTAATIADAVLDEAKGEHAGHLASIPTNTQFEARTKLAADYADKITLDNTLVFVSGVHQDYQQRGQSVTLPVGTGVGEIALSGGYVKVKNNYAI
jgi:hypothetical protein